MHVFYSEILEIPEADLQTTKWSEVVRRLLHVHERYRISVAKENMDALDIANRIMRRENYLIALFNKRLITLEVPYLSTFLGPLLTRSMEWNLQLCILNHVFDDQYSVHKRFLQSSGRQVLVDG